MVVKHKIPLKTQNSSSNCVQTSVSQFLEFYNVKINPSEIEKKIPVRFNQSGKPMGTLFPDIAIWLEKELKIKTKMYVFDVQIIDPSWKGISKKELKNRIHKLKEEGVSTSLTSYTKILINSYNDYINIDGDIEITRCTNSLLRDLLNKGPVLAIINYNYMYSYSRVKYDSKINNYVKDSYEGKVIQHAIVLTGYEDGYYYYNDPDSEMGGQHKVKDDVMVGSICAAQIDSMNYLLIAKV